jgi:uncharacterized protein YukE
MAGNGSFMVDLGALSHAIGQVSAEREAMHGKISALRGTFNDVADKWKSPAGTTFVSAVEQFNSITDHFMSVLDDAISRMRSVYHTYVSVEEANTNNLK